MDGIGNSFYGRTPSTQFNHPSAITADGTRIWVANTGGDSVTELNAATGLPIRVLTGPGTGLTGPTLSPRMAPASG